MTARDTGHPISGSCVTEFVSFAVAKGKESRAEEWLATLQSRKSDCVATLDREHMHFESVFSHLVNGRMYLSWFSVQGTAGQPLSTSELEVDRVHRAYWQECIDGSMAPIEHRHVVDFVPVEVANAISERGRRLLSSRETDVAPATVHQDEPDRRR